MLVLAISLAGFAPLSAQLRFEGWFGQAFNANSPVTLRQAGEADLHLMGHWSTKPWSPTWYFAMRFSKWNGSKAWAFEYMHHKIYLDNPTAEVTEFRITNGVNNFLAERLWRVKGWEFGVGAGPVLAVPLSTVRNKSYGDPNGIFWSRYELAGATVQANLARRLKLLPYTYGELALKGTISGLDVRIADGRATLMNYALHLQYGISFQSKR